MAHHLLASAVVWQFACLREADEVAQRLAMALRPRASVRLLRTGRASVTVRWANRTGELTQTATLRCRPDALAGLARLR